ncbi:hypothetical protein P9112_004098 [Eukaryota sp. TZLM1-RC]
MTGHGPSSWRELIKQYDAERKRAIYSSTPHIITHKQMVKNFNPVTQKFSDQTTEMLMQKKEQVLPPCSSNNKSSITFDTSGSIPRITPREKSNKFEKAKSSYSAVDYNIIRPPSQLDSSTSTTQRRKQSSVDYNIITPPNELVPFRKRKIPQFSSGRRTRNLRLLRDRSTKDLGMILSNVYSDRETQKQDNHKTIKRISELSQYSNHKQSIKVSSRRFECNETLNDHNLITGIPCRGLDSRTITNIKVNQNPSVREILLCE